MFYEKLPDELKINNHQNKHQELFIKVAKNTKRFLEDNI